MFFNLSDSPLFWHANYVASETWYTLSHRRLVLLRISRGNCGSLFDFYRIFQDFCRYFYGTLDKVTQIYDSFRHNLSGDLVIKIFDLFIRPLDNFRLPAGGRKIREKFVRLVGADGRIILLKIYFRNSSLKSHSKQRRLKWYNNFCKVYRIKNLKCIEL